MLPRHARSVRASCRLPERFNEEAILATEPTIIIHFKDMSVDEEVRDHIRARFDQLASEFPEVAHCELTIRPDAKTLECHGHVTGKRTKVAAHANGIEHLRPVADAVLDKLERELRTEHDKRIFSQRRKAQKDRAKRAI
jgi:ribosome-associated translation inhibitor RaiA